MTSYLAIIIGITSVFAAVAILMWVVALIVFEDDTPQDDEPYGDTTNYKR